MQYPAGNIAVAGYGALAWFIGIFRYHDWNGNPLPISLSKPNFSSVRTAINQMRTVQNSYYDYSSEGFPKVHKSSTL